MLIIDYVPHETLHFKILPKDLYLRHCQNFNFWKQEIIERKMAMLGSRTLI